MVAWYWLFVALSVGCMLGFSISALLRYSNEEISIADLIDREYEKETYAETGRRPTNKPKDNET